MDINKVNMVDVSLYKNEYRIFKPVENTTRKKLK
jgi:hypothetical protein